MPTSSSIFAIFSAVGWAIPVSQAETACGETPSASASAERVIFGAEGVNAASRSTAARDRGLGVTNNRLQHVLV